MAAVASPTTTVRVPNYDRNDVTTSSSGIKNGLSPNHQQSSSSHSPRVSAEVKERKYDLNSFASNIKFEADQSDGDDDVPLSVRKAAQNNVQQKDNHRLPAVPSSKHQQPGVVKKDKNNIMEHVSAKIPPLIVKKEKDPKLVESPTKPSISSKDVHGGGSSASTAPKVKVHDLKVEQHKQQESPKKQPEHHHHQQQQKPTVKRPVVESDDEDDVSLAERAKKVKNDKTVKNEKPVKNETNKKTTKKRKNESDDEDDCKPEAKKSKSDKHHKEKDKKHKTKVLDTLPSSPSKKGKSVGSGKKGKKEEESHEVWKWWEEEKREDGIKWKFLEHKGVMFAPPYVPLPSGVNFYYDGNPMKLSESAEEVATFYAKMLEHDYVSQEVFNKNFYKDWRKMMSAKEKEKIVDLKKCDFKEMCEYFKKISEERKSRSKDEKQKEKEERDRIQKEFGMAVLDGHKEKIGNFRIEPPGLFRGRGVHPKMGMLKRRVMPEDVIINCSKDSKIPVPPAGHKWKEVRHDNTVTWLASWSENIMGSIKYVMLNPASKIKGEKDWQKYEVARKLKTKVTKIRDNYKEDWKSKEMKVRQRAVALYFIDKLALRAGNEKEEGETADTVGCCSLRYEHIKLYENLDGEECVVEFDFLGKDSIRYYNKVPVEKRVFKNLKLFMEKKSNGDDVFDRLNTSILNEHLRSLMNGLTAKVFRTYNASSTLQQQLDLLTKENMTPAEKMLAYNRANRQVAILCNHQRSVPKAHSKQMESLQEKIKEKRGQVKQAKREAKEAKKKSKSNSTENNKKQYEQKKKQADRLDEQLQKLELKATDKEENKEIALGTSKLNYLDPRISVAWCKKWNVPIEKVYNKTQREKFRWAIDMATPDFHW